MNTRAEATKKTVSGLARFFQSLLSCTNGDDCDIAILALIGKVECRINRTWLLYSAEIHRSSARRPYGKLGLFQLKWRSFFGSRELGRNQGKSNHLRMGMGLWNSRFKKSRFTSGCFPWNRVFHEPSFPSRRPNRWPKHLTLFCNPNFSDFYEKMGLTRNFNPISKRTETCSWFKRKQDIFSKTIPDLELIT